MNPFYTSMASTTASVAAMCGESFIVVRGGNAGTYDAISIEDVEVDSPRAMPGGKFSDASVRLYVTKAVLARAGIKADTVLNVRGKNVRILNDPASSDDGSDTETLECGPVGIKLS